AHTRSRVRSHAAKADQLWNTEAWYTLNAIPGYKTPADSGFYEAEEAALLGGMQYDTEHSGYSRSGFAGTLSAVGSGVRWQVEVDEDGVYPVRFRYASGV